MLVFCVNKGPSLSFTKITIFTYLRYTYACVALAGHEATRNKICSIFVTACLYNSKIK